MAIALRAALRDVFVFRRADPARSWIRSFLYTALLTWASVSFHYSVLTRTHILPGIGHGGLSIVLAMNHVYCGAPSHLDVQNRIAQLLLDSRRRDVPLRSLPERVGGSLERFCADVTQPTMNNENSFGLVVRLILLLDSEVSLKGLASYLLLLNCVAFSVVVLMLMRWNAPMLFGLSVLWLALDVLADAPFGYYSVYPCLAGLLLLTLVAYAAALDPAWVASPRRWFLFLGAAGLATGFLVNFRTSHGPIYLALAAAYITVSIWPREWSPQFRGPSLRRGVLGLATFALGVLAFQLLVLRSITPSDTGRNRTYHVIAHALTLGLAMPPNPLTEREGIRWDDGAGLALARRVDPGVQYLGPGYETALFRYYTGLWQRFPREMLDVYRLKMKSAAPALLIGSITTANSRSRTYGNAGLVSRLPGFSAVLPFILVTPLLLAVICRRHVDRRLQWLLWMGSFAALLVVCEAAIIFSFFDPGYHGFVQVWVLVLCLVAGQWFIQAGEVALTASGRWWHRAGRPGRFLAVGCALATLTVISRWSQLPLDRIAGSVRTLATPPTFVVESSPVVKPGELVRLHLSVRTSGLLLVFHDGKVVQQGTFANTAAPELRLDTEGEYGIEVHMDDPGAKQRVVEARRVSVTRGALE